MANRLKVLLISPLYRGGGAERCARELCERLPEVGDPEKPRLVFFFDEAHLLFAEAPAGLLQKIRCGA